MKIAARLVWVALSIGSVPVAAALEINDASRAQLEQLNGLGVARVEQILRARARAPFASWDDLRMRVKGIGVKGAQRLAAQGLTVNGSTPAEKRTP